MQSEKKKILVIDDDEDFTFFTKRNLERDNYEVIAAKDGESGIHMANKSKPDIILLDILMPGIDGFETLRRLKAAPQTSPIPVIVLTGKNDEESKEKASQLKDADYIVKPVEVEELRLRVKKALQEPGGK